MKETPLAGLKVVELARILAGPWAGQVLAGPINTVAQAFADPQVVACGMVVEVVREDGSTLPAVRRPIRFADAALAIGRAAALLGGGG